MQHALDKMTLTLGVTNPEVRRASAASWSIWRKALMSGTELRIHTRDKVSAGCSEAARAYIYAMSRE